jgi:hypothetical protein
MLRISGGILNMLERKLFRSQDQPPSTCCCQQPSSLTSSTVPEGRPDTSVKQARMTQPSSSCSKRRPLQARNKVPRKRDSDDSPQAGKRRRLESGSPLDDIEVTHRRRVVWMPRFEEAYPCSISKSVQLLGGSILSKILHKILLQEFPSSTNRSAIRKFVRDDSTLCDSP